MSESSKIFKIKGFIQHYAWGGNTFIPELLGVPNPDGKPCAEYWLGAHPSAAAKLIIENKEVALNELIARDPATALTDSVYQKFGELPYLLKVLDVKQMLSIQVHPSKEEAEKGFDREEAEGIPINAPNRNYKDRNHKPEVMVALSDFWLLHGFKEKSLLENTLSEVYEFNILLPLFKRDGYKALYQFVMEMSQQEVNAFLMPTVKREIRRKREGELSKAEPGWWVAKLFENDEQIVNIDRGVFSIYFFNIVNAKPGEAVFQGAGLPHAYLEGQNIELMANSDNVLRGGLTPKHIDVPELMKHTVFEGIIPNVMKGNEIRIGEKNYPCPVPDFSISKIELKEDMTYSNSAEGMELLIVTEGAAVINNSLVLKRGEAACLFPDAVYEIITSGNCTLFKAFV
ncbi:MAG: mannose-6-phosphate isomerase, class I [Chitinophagaceae bacterium]|nr:mannose-6-phosphate isomerase, class I [Chitinophagaceae bacterium]